MTTHPATATVAKLERALEAASAYGIELETELPVAERRAIRAMTSRMMELRTELADLERRLAGR